MDKKELEKYVEKGYTYKELSSQFCVGQTSIAYWLKKYGLKTKNCNGPRRIQLEDGCRICGEKNPKNFYMSGGRLRYSVCKKCYKITYGRRRVERLREIKRDWVNYKGGKCQICGYDKCIAALDFHHTHKKDPEWKRMRGWKFDRVLKELDKCILVCSNCHREIHDKIYNDQEFIMPTKKVRKIFHVTCSHCNKQFNTTNEDQIYCSHLCSQFAQRKVINRPSKQQLEKEIALDSWSAIGKRYGVSDNTIRKWAKGYGLIQNVGGASKK